MLYVMSDIHGHLQRFESIMEQIKLGEGDHLFVLGDVIDRHPDGIQILQKLIRMAYSKVSIPSEVFHFTQKQNLEQILSDRRIRRFGDTECWFCRSVEDMLRYMDMTVMNEGQKYIAPDRTIKRYPKFEPENYVMLRLVPAKWEDKWYQWNQELPANVSPESRQQAKEFLELKLGYRGDLRFSQVEVFEMTEVMGIAPTQEQDTTFPNLTM